MSAPKPIDSASRQLPLALQLRRSSSLQEFVDQPHKPLLPLLAQQRVGGEPLIFIHGEPLSGRSHLLLGQCDAAQQAGLAVTYLPARDQAELDPLMLQGLQHIDLLAIDDVHALAGKSAWENALFVLFNQFRDTGRSLLCSAKAPPGECGFSLPDLASRLAWGPVCAITPLDDDSRQELLCRLAARRGLSMPSEVARYLVQRRSRDTASLLDMVERLDRASLAEQRRLSIPFVREQLQIRPAD